MTYGKHIMLRIGGIERIDAINSGSCIKQFLTDLTHHIRMNVLVPAVAGFEDGDAQHIGWSGVIILCESHIAIHAYPALRQAFIDVFSCKEYSEQDIYGFLHDRIGRFEVLEESVLDRGRHWGADIDREFLDWQAER